MSPPIDITAIKALSAAATPGPWEWRSSGWGGEPELCSGPGWRHSVAVALGCSEAFIQVTDPDAEFIARSRTMVDDLVAEVERLRAELAASQQEVDSIYEAGGETLLSWGNGNIREGIRQMLCSRENHEAESERLRAAAEWRSDEPPLLPYEGRDRSDPIEIHLRHSDERVIARVYRKWGDLLYLFGNWTPLGPVGTDWKWRPIGPNPFEQEQT